MKTSPSALPYSLLSDPKLSAERRVFESLKKIEYEDHSTAFHSLRLSEHEYKREGEIDFLILGPSGLFVIEVKGGRVRRNEHGVWVYSDRHGRDHESHEGPFQQARSAMYSLVEAIKERFGQGLVNDMTYGFGVIAPAAQLAVATPEWAPCEVLDRDGYRSDGDLERFLKRLRDHYREKRGGSATRLNHGRVDDIAGFLRPRFDRVAPLMRHIDESHVEQESLTAEQYRLIDANAANERVLCVGGAGTGKTFVGVEWVRRTAAADAPTLFTCRSETLAAHVRGLLDGVPGAEVVEADRLSERAGRDFARAVVDEGQDLLSLDYLTRINDALVGGLDGGRWLFFYDGNRQSGFYGDTDPEALDLLLDSRPARLRLDRNCRNPGPVVSQTRLFTGGDLGLPSSGEGPAVTVRYVRGQADASRELESQLESAFEGGARPGSVSIISPLPYVMSSASRLPSALRRLITPLTLETARRFPLASVSFSSIRDFKGFENDVVIVTDLSEDSLLPSPENALYVAMSRARVKLVMLMAEEMRSTIAALVQRHLPLLVVSERSPL